MKNKSLRTFVAMWLLTAGLFTLSESLAQTGATAPMILTQPSNQIVNFGDNVVLTVVPNESPVRYQWRKNGVALADYGNVAGAQTATLKLVGVSQIDVAGYSVVVRNSAGVVTSAVAQVTVRFITVVSDDFESGTNLAKWAAFSEVPGLREAMELDARVRDPAKRTNHLAALNATNQLAKAKPRRFTDPVKLSRTNNPFINTTALLPTAARLRSSQSLNHTPEGLRSAQVVRARDKMYHNLGTELAGLVRATFWIYDNGIEGAAFFGELRGYSGAGHDAYIEPGGLGQLFAIGRNDFGPNQKVPGGGRNKRAKKWTGGLDETKYQGRVERGKATASGWFNLDAPGTPDRSVGWHKFEIVRAADGTNVDFYVDGVLGRRVTGVDDALLDCVTIGSLGADGVPVSAWFDDVKVETVPWRYDWQGKDSAGKGLFDWMRLRETGTDPQVTDIAQINSVLEANGAAANGVLGRWASEGPGFQALDQRGAVEYALQVPANDAYRIEVEGRGRSDIDELFPSPVVISIDGELLGRFVLPYSNETNGVVHCFTPFLNAGPHTVRIDWDGARSHASLYLRAVRLQSLAGPDANQNNVKDWVENRLLAQSGIEVAPLESPVSPVCVEGRGQYLSMMQLRAGDTNGELSAVTIQPGAGHRWYANVPLLPFEPTRVRVVYQNGGLQEDKEITWRVTNLLQDDDITIRQGDALLLTAVPVGATAGEVRLAILGMTNYVTDVATPFPHRFDQAGTFTVTGTFIGQSRSSRQITVRVVAASFDGPVSAWVGKWRYWDCTNLPPEVVIEADPRVEISRVSESVRRAHIPEPPPLGTNGRQYKITLDQAEPRTVLARLGPNGPVLASVAVDGFRLFSTEDTYLRRLSTFEDGSHLLEAAFILSPPQNNVSVSVNITVSGVTFEDGTVTKTLVPSDFDNLGICRVRFIRAPGVVTSVCHIIKAIQNGAVIGRPAYEK